MIKKQKILIADSHSLVRIGVKEVLLSNLSGISILEVNQAEDILKVVYENDIDLLILDINISKSNFVSLLSSLNKVAPKLAILVFSIYPEIHLSKRAFHLGALAYLGKEVPVKTFLKVVNKLLNYRMKSGKKSGLLLNRKKEKIKLKSQFDLLSNREFEVMMLLLKGKTQREITQIVNISSSAVSTYKMRLFQKLGIRNLTSLIQLADSSGLI